MWIEIFRTGRHTSSNGNELNFSVDDLDKIANLYNSRNAEGSAALAPLVKGHPKNDEPAHGWVERLARRGNYLLAKLRDLTPVIIDEVRNKQYQRISIALTRDMHLKHVGLLGAVSPAVEGLSPVAFTELDDNIELEYLHNDESVTHLIHQNNELKERVENYERTLVSRDLIEFTSDLVKRRIIPSTQKNNALDILELAYNVDRITENEYSLLDKLKSFFHKMQFNSLQKEFATNHTSNNFGEFGNGKEFLADRDKLHKAVLEYMERNTEINYEQALTNLIK